MNTGPFSELMKCISQGKAPWSIWAPPPPMGFGLVHIVPRLVCWSPWPAGEGEGGFWSISIKHTGESGLIHTAQGVKDLVQGESVWRARLPVVPRAVGPRELKTEVGL